jgi:hypothetical protein
MKAHYARTVSCGHYVNVGEPIVRVADKQFVCVACAVAVAQEEQRRTAGVLDEEQRRRAERLLDDPKIRAMLVRALVTDSDDEAATALAAARRLHRKAPAA